MYKPSHLYRASDLQFRSWQIYGGPQGFSFAKTCLGVIAVVAIQRFIYKLIISLALTREFRADTANVAWWTGKWYAMGWHTVSQPGREFLCKITEMGFFSADFILGHIILFLLLPALLVPYIDKFHSVMLFWLRPRYVLPTMDRFITNISLVDKFVHQSTLSSRQNSESDESFVTQSCTFPCL